MVDSRQPCHLAEETSTINVGMLCVCVCVCVCVLWFLAMELQVGGMGINLDLLTRMCKIYKCSQIFLDKYALWEPNE